MAKSVIGNGGAADNPLVGMTSVVTGASSGIGLETARGLAAKGTHVVLAVRSPERGRAAASAVLASNPDASLEVMELDLADLTSIRHFAEAFRSRFDDLHLLINNAGIASNSLQNTADGFELVFGTNHLGHFALTGLLLPLIIAARQARVVTVTSMAHGSGQIDFDNLDASRRFSPSAAYAESKLANVLFAYELQRRFSAARYDQLSVACHPGWAATNMTVGSDGQSPRPQGRVLRALARHFAPSAADGARPVLFAATSPEVGPGDFIGPSGRFGVGGRPARVRSSARSYDQDLARNLWNTSESLTGVRYELAVTEPAPTGSGGKN
jgi:NAD(P)-dependent dehydrogenase (short-subunit alcohol dehydrogenase family)